MRFCINSLAFLPVVSVSFSSFCFLHKSSLPHSHRNTWTFDILWLLSMRRILDSLPSVTRILTAFLIVQCVTFPVASLNTFSVNTYPDTAPLCLVRPDKYAFLLKRHLSYHGTVDSLRLEVTDRASHRILSHILAILLREKLGFTNITFHITAWDSVDDTLRRLANSSSSRPSSHVNVETLIPPGYDLQQWVLHGSQQVLDAGPLGPVVQMAVFVSVDLMNTVNRELHIAIDHYRVLTESQELRNWLRNRETIDDATSPTRNFSHYYNDQYTLIFDQCQLNSERNDTCFNLFLDRQEFVSGVRILLQQVFLRPTFRVFLLRDSDLLTNWLRSGSHFNASHMPRMDFFIHWHPSVLTVSQNFTPLILPDEYYFDGPHSTLNEENIGSLQWFAPMYQVSKVMWAPLRRHASSIYELVKRVHFTQAEVVYLLKKVRNPPAASAADSREEEAQAVESDYYKIACQWLKENEKKWSEWIVKESLSIHAMLPSSDGKWFIPNLYETAQSAVTLLNKEHFVNTSYLLNLTTAQMPVLQEAILGDYMDRVDRCPHGHSTVIGIVAAFPAKELETLVMVTNLHHRVVISPTVASAQYLSTQKRYEYFFRTASSRRYYSHLLLNVMATFKWRRVVLLRNDDKTLVWDNLQNKLNLLMHQEFADEEMNFTVATKVLREADEMYFGRIFILEFSQSTTRTIFCAAAKLNMTAARGYVWFVRSQYDTDTHVLETAPCSQMEMLTVMDYHFLLKPAGKEQTQRGSEVDQPSGERATLSNTAKKNGTSDEAFTYDAVYILGLAAFNVLQSNHGAMLDVSFPDLASRFRETVATTQFKRTFHGSTTPTEVRFNGNNERDSLNWALLQRRNRFYTVLIQWKMLTDATNSTNRDTLNDDDDGDNATESWDLVQMDDGSQWRVLHQLGDNNLEWTKSLGKVPDDGAAEAEAKQKSLFEASCFVNPLPIWLGLSCQGTLSLLSVLAFICLLTVSAAIVYHYRRKWRLAQDEFERPFMQMLSELHSLIIPLSHLSRTRRLGEGAFAMVYGGELQLRNGRMENVAVKETKDSLSYEHKMDFLREVRIMSRLHHENIPHFYGICVEPGPRGNIFMVMEALQHGDLKAYLLDRRADCRRDPQRFDLCPRTLTQFALDLCNALQYMHECNLVHRDVACRNCLVSVDYRLKLTDFGLSREMHCSHQDRYYRLDRMKTLPVRWLSPQALNFGRYDVYTDIWSYGVTLFEMVTFGNDPYDCSNTEVRERVKRHEIFICDSLPVKARGKDVYRLIGDCCAFEVSDRPASMRFIREILQRNPQLVQPCLTDDPPRNIIPHAAHHVPVPMKLPHPPPPSRMSSTQEKSSSRSTAGVTASFADSQDPSRRLCDMDPESRLSVTISRRASRRRLGSASGVALFSQISQSLCDLGSHLLFLRPGTGKPREEPAETRPSPVRSAAPSQSDLQVVSVVGKSTKANKHKCNSTEFLSSSRNMSGGCCASPPSTASDGSTTIGISKPESEGLHFSFDWSEFTDDPMASSASAGILPQTNIEKSDVVNDVLQRLLADSYLHTNVDSPVTFYEEASPDDTFANSFSPKTHQPTGRTSRSLLRRSPSPILRSHAPSASSIP